MSINLKNKKILTNKRSPTKRKKWIENITTDHEEIKIVSEVLKSGSLSLFEGSHKPDRPFSFEGGPYVKQLEKNWSKYYNIKYSVSFNSATSCLYAAVGALEIGFGDEVIVSPYTMTACAMAPMIYGAIPIFADVEKNTGCLDVESIKKLISKKTKAIIVVHQFGFPADMQKILKLAKKHNLKIIEDCAQAHGAKFKGKYVGTFGDIGVFSLNVNKTIQSGEGGICITNSKSLDYRLKLIRNHGEAVVGPAKYKNIINIAGFNYRMTELTAAIAIIQLKKLNFLNKTRIALVNYFRKEIKDFNFLTPLKGREECSNCKCKKKCKNTYYLFPMLFNKKKTNVSRSRFVDTLNKEGVKFYEGYTKPLYHQPVYQNKKLFKNGYPFTAKENLPSSQSYKKKISPVAEKMFSEDIIICEHIRFPHTKSDIDFIIKVLKKITN
tara:strand:- start:8306 stop:9619 length:1314 start_codon:yes stop_codon:yes gene_type:complete